MACTVFQLIHTHATRLPRIADGHMVILDYPNLEGQK